ncbi:trypsin delta-like isoform X3 [Schistocerca nitens]|uniref:trypsin delta-like isoform X2 n=1 Tax=Schistocerca nitens TaxID=7011 RepID=UPI0021179B3B|nr:trypsin delta-like isoform X2 [Schistocerca nitens]XP_049816194.1 trypsin delta-like isoform X3 [Schistocerca nitens]
MQKCSCLLLLVLAVAFCHAGLVRPRKVPKLWRPRLSGRIVGGSAVSISQYPWQLYFEANGSPCGASIISSNWALSAAHCVEGVSLTSLQLRAGTSTRGSGGSVHSVSGGQSHSSYNSATVDYDICVLQVSNAFSFGSNVQAVSLTSSEPSAGTSVTVSGFGALSSGGLSSNLQAVTVQIIDRNTCNAAYGSITSRMICAGVSGGGKDACQGDSGGPLVSGSTQVGIVSFGTGCGLADYPGVYANVANLRSWIQSATGV